MIGEEEVKEVKKLENYLIEYSTYTKAKRLGITFTPTDLTMEQVNAFSIIDNKINEIEAKKAKQWQKK